MSKYQSLAYQDKIVFETGGMNGHVCSMADFFSEEKINAYGRLFAAAPDMMAAIEETLTPNGCPVKSIQMLVAALKKAQGQS